MIWSIITIDLPVLVRQLEQTLASDPPSAGGAVASARSWEELLAMNESIAANVGPANIDIAHERIGDPDAPPVLLIQGLAMQLLGWPDGFCTALVERGLHVIRFDNRDVGRSSHLSDAPAPDLPAVLHGDLSSVSYTLSDMAADTIGLLDVLGIDSAHLVGASMGGARHSLVAPLRSLAKT